MWLYGVIEVETTT